MLGCSVGIKDGISDGCADDVGAMEGAGDTVGALGAKEGDIVGFGVAEESKSFSGAS